MESLFISTKPELLVTGFVFTEGPLWHPDEVLYVSDVDAQIHYKVQLGEKVVTEVIRNSSGGANGAVFDKNGCLVVCEQDARRVVRYELDGSITVLVDNYGGKRLNRSNDIILHHDSSLYFTDPDKKGLEESDKELGFASIFRINVDGDLVLLANDMNHPNGLGFSVDGKTLYVSNSRPDPHLHAYSVDSSGLLINSRIVADSGISKGKPWIPVNSKTLETSITNVFAIGDVNVIPSGEFAIPKAGVFASGQGKKVGEIIASQINQSDTPDPYDGVGLCYLSYSGGRSATVGGKFLTGSGPETTLSDPTVSGKKHKDRFERDWRNFKI